MIVLVDYRAYTTLPPGLRCVIYCFKEKEKENKKARTVTDSLILASTNNDRQFRASTMPIGPTFFHQFSTLSFALTCRRLGDQNSCVPGGQKISARRVIVGGSRWASD